MAKITWIAQCRIFEPRKFLEAAHSRKRYRRSFDAFMCKQNLPRHNVPVAGMAADFEACFERNIFWRPLQVKEEYKKSTPCSVEGTRVRWYPLTYAFCAGFRYLFHPCLSPLFYLRRSYYSRADLDPTNPFFDTSPEQSLGIVVN